VIATGSRPRIPELPGLEKVAHLDYIKVLELRKVPRHLIVLGGGYIACEYSHMFRRLGARVSIVQHGPQLLSREDTDVSAEIATILRDEGIDIYLDAKATHVEPLEDGVKLHLQNGPQLRGSHLLIATGIAPNTEELELENTGVQLDEKGHVQTDEYLEAAPNTYALGDVKGGPAFTHISFDDARILHARLAEGKRVSTRERLVPYVVFTDPQLGRIGLSEKEAQKANLRYRVAKLPVSDVARGIETGQKHGFLKAIVEAGTNRILGGAFICEEGGDIMAILQVAMMGNLPYPVLRDGIFAHPTMAEALNNLFLAMEREEKGIAPEYCIRTSCQ
jgi:pyruvate/2-oxoglutarate dehydrogenase complex dihydrolipoamide dehydrogenase (E3) component